MGRGATMRATTWGRPARVCSRAATGVLGVLAAVAAVVLVGAGPAAADGTDPQPQSVRLAAALRSDPVYVTDQLPRGVPRSTKTQFTALARRTGVPTYVMV